MSVSSVTNSPSTGLSSSAIANSSKTTTAKTPTKTLGETDFLQLLSTQLQNQDPMQPMDDTQFIAQMAQFSSLQSMSQMQANQQQTNAVSYIGLNVTVQDATGNNVTGVVTAVDNSGSTPALVINGTSYALSTVQRVEIPPAATTTSATTAAALAAAAAAGAATTSSTTTTPAASTTTTSG